MNRQTQIARPPVTKLLIVEAFVIGLGTIISWQWNPIIAQSWLYGGCIFMIPTAYFARFSFRFMGANKASEVNRSFYRGEAGKFILTAMMFAATFLLVKPLSVPTLFISYALLALLHVIAAGLILNRHKMSK